ncbi:MAG: M48 family metallopeptidase [Alistipes senegalensis]|nr:M48 family metallopeptidase [Oxalobacter formigenes]MCM1280573.1 M48 family metallopeptidase [Alistipes senegalensis]
MTPCAFTLIFIFFLALTLSVRLWLSLRQIRHVRLHRDSVPAQFARDIPLAAHRKAADYTIAKRRFAIFTILADTLVLLCFTLFGGLDLLHTWIYRIAGPGMLCQIGLLAAFALISGLIDLPFDYYSQFVVEEKFGFNNMTPKLFFADLAKSMLMSALIGLPLAWLVLVLMEKASNAWWFYAWLVWNAFQLLMMILYPTLIAPLFNTFTPLQDQALKERIERLLERTGFKAGGLFVMDGSRRSAHGNAYFTGFGASRRIVFYDTLISRLSPPQIEAVLAHELGHFKLRHIAKRMALMAVVSLGFLALLGYLKTQGWFYLGLHVTPLADGSPNALALLLFVLVLPLFTFFFSPLLASGSRKHEFEADAFSSKHTSAQDLALALVSMYEDNASTLTPDPLYSAFYDSHPPASARIDRLLARP